MAGLWSELFFGERHRAGAGVHGRLGETARPRQVLVGEEARGRDLGAVKSASPRRLQFALRHNGAGHLPAAAPRRKVQERARAPG